MDCQRAEELLSDRLEGSLHPILGAELEAHLASCEACRELAEAVAEAVGALRNAPELEAPGTLAERAASAALARPRTIEIRPAFVLPHWLNAAAAGFALRDKQIQVCAIITLTCQQNFSIWLNRHSLSYPPVSDYTAYAKRYV